MSGAHSTSHVNALRHFPEKGIVAWNGKEYAPMMPRGVHEFVVDPIEGDDDKALAGIGDWATVQACLDNAVVSGRGDRIMILPKYTMSAVVEGRTYDFMRETVVCDKDNVAFIGVQASPKWAAHIGWKPAVDGETCLAISGAACAVIGLYFRMTGGGHGIKIDCQSAVQAKGVNIINNRFCCMDEGGMGIQVCGGDNLLIEGNYFEYINGDGWAIGHGYSGFQHPQRLHVIGNVIQNCDNGLQLSSCLGLFKDNVFDGTGDVNLDTFKASGEKNIVTGNFFGGDYVWVGGGYRAAAGDLWFGNFSPSVARAQVGTDTGLTIAVPWGS